MPAIDEIAFLYPSGGMNGAGAETLLPENQFRRSTNVVLRDQIPSTRPRIRILAPESLSASATDADFYRVNNVQGAKFFNPSKGQGGFVLAKDEAMILCACGGLKFTITFEGSGGSTVAKIKNISNGIQTSHLLHLVWWGVWETYALAQDGSSNCFIWPAYGDAFTSAGYDSIDKPSSSVPNGATVMAYAHGRGICVVNSRIILVGDSLHRTDQSSAKNLLDFVEQVYWATGQYFLPPSAMGNILAAEILPQRSTQHGHGDLMFHCEDGVFSLDINIYPRSEWANRQMVKHALLQAGAVGPYAIALRDGDQVYRTRHGITTLRSAAAQSAVEGNPQTPLSEPVSTWLKADVPEWLRFCSLVVWESEHRMLCTIDPTLDGRFRWHRGIVVRNYQPAPMENSPACWEGVWTLPAQAAGIVQLINGIFASEERTFALVRGADGINRIAEFTSDFGDDILEDGSRERIRCQLITRGLILKRPFQKKEFVSGTISVNAVGLVDWGVWVKAQGNANWVLWRFGKINAAPEDEGEFIARQPFTKPIALGNFPKTCEAELGASRSFQFLIRWKGVMQLVGLRLMISPGDTDSEKLDAEAFNVRFDIPLSGDYSDFEYSDGPDWTTSLST